MTSANNHPEATGLDAIKGAAADVVRQWKEVAASARELAAFGDTMANIAHDLGLSPNELRSLASRGPGAAKEMPKLLEALHISIARIAERDPLVLRDLQRVCSLCDSKRRCHGDIAAGTLAEHYQDYCPNAQTMEALASDPTFKAP